MHSHVRNHILSTLLMTLLALLPVLGSAQDTSTPAPPEFNPEVQISIRPKDGSDGDRFNAEVKPGETATLIVVLQNFGEGPIELRTFTSDVIPMTNGGLQMDKLDSEQHGTTLWINYPSETFTLKPGESIERPMVITVPKNTEAGQYVNAIALETVNPVNAGQGGAFEQFFRKVVSVYVTVPGDLASDFSLGEPEVLVVQGRSGVQIPIENTGDVRLDIMGTLSLTDSSGKVVHEGPIRLGPIYKGQATLIQVAFASVPPAGDYTIKYEFTDSTSGVTHNLDSQAVVVPENESLEQAPISYENVSVTANADPIVFADVSVDVNLAQTSCRSSRLTLSVYRDGEFVEDFVLAENLSLAQGVTTVSQRYLPATGWEPGTYSFSLKLEATDSGTASILLEEADVATLEVP